MGVLVLAAIGGGSCKRPPEVVHTGTGPTISTFGDLNPDRFGDKTAILDYSGTKIPVTVETHREGNVFSIVLSAMEQETDREVYTVQPNEFDLQQGVSETYTPPLPLLKFPMNVGDTWAWKGTLSTGVPPPPATATIETSADKVYLKDRGNVDAVKVTVNLLIEGGGPDKVQRTLSLWFVKDLGPVKREFGKESSRLPPEK